MTESRRDSVGPTPHVEIEKNATDERVGRLSIGTVRFMEANRIVIESFSKLGQGTAIAILPRIDVTSSGYFSCRGQVVRTKEVSKVSDERWMLDVVLDPFPVRYINNLERFFQTFGDEKNIVPPGSIVAQLILDSSGPSQTLRPSNIPPSNENPGRYGLVDKSFFARRKSEPPEED